MSATAMGDGGMTVKLLGTCEAARILGVHRNTIRHWAQNGILRARELPTGARRFDPDEVERVRAQIHEHDLDESWTDAVRIDHLILRRVDRAVRVGERELRYQLEQKDEHPLAQADELLDVLVQLEAEGLVESEWTFRLTARGRERLADLAASSAVAGCSS